jgi:DNA helicase-2/ATP-dependent DNA helicase PcrA
MVVGDDDQAIYGFRGALPQMMSNFYETDFMHVSLIKLEQNYRRTKKILQLSNAVIANNRGRIGKSLWTEKTNNEKIRIKGNSHDKEEARYVANEILTRMEQQGKQIKRIGKGTSSLRYKDIAILCRTNPQINALEKEFIRSKIPYSMKGTLFYDREEIQHVISYGRLLYNRNDDVSFERVCNVPSRGVSDSILDKIKSVAVSTACRYGLLLKSSLTLILRPLLLLLLLLLRHHCLMPPLLL